MSRRAPQSVIEDLSAALKAARMGTANFDGIGDKMTFNGEAIDIDSFVKERIRIYMQTWVIPQIEDALSWAEGR
jgi:hypothetical protein